MVDWCAKHSLRRNHHNDVPYGNSCHAHVEGVDNHLPVYNHVDNGSSSSGGSGSNILWLLTSHFLQWRGILRRIANVGKCRRGFMAINLISIELQILRILAFCTTISAYYHCTLARRDSLKVTNERLVFDDVCCHLLFQSTYVISLPKLGTIHGNIIDLK